jgi:hypothetical protein
LPERRPDSPDAASANADPGSTEEETKVLELKQDLANRNKMRLRQMRADSGQP